MMGMPPGRDTDGALVQPVPGIEAAFDHVAVAAPEIRPLLHLYCGILGARYLYGGVNREYGFKAITFRFAGGGKIELLEPLAESTFLDSFLERTRCRGGLHHITFVVDSLEEAIEAASHQGLETFGRDTHEGGWSEVFIHPRAAAGVLIQLVENLGGWDTPNPESLAELLAAR